MSNSKQTPERNDAATAGYWLPRTCLQCGKRFAPKKSTHYTCSWRCYQDYQEMLEAEAKQPYKGHPF